MEKVKAISRSLGERIRGVRGEKGQGMVEYGVILAIICAIGITFMSSVMSDDKDSVSGKIRGMYSNSIDQVTNTMNQAGRR